MHYLTPIFCSLIFIIGSILIIYGSSIQHKYLKDESFFEYLWFILMDWLIIGCVGIGLCICLPILILL